ncbi:MAG: PIN domain-containing protein [Nitrospinae bacterium]|nr:PIN domain-containing protein [Nitrospinota bacterium]
MKDKILIDTSVWIQFFRKKDSEVSDKLKKLLIEERTAVSGIISMELYRGASGDKELAFLDRFLPLIHYIPTGEESYKNAGLIGFTLSKKGVNIGTVDLLIAQISIENNISLYTQDKHFKEIAKHFPLALYT